MKLPSDTRVQSVDVLRGIVMIIMAIDHVRVYSGMPAGGPEAGIFFTRWITHYCAPSFAFFAGTSAFLYYHKTGDKKQLASFLLTRGLILVVFELTIIRFFWTFNFGYANFTITGVIWMLGWCMILLAAFVRLKPLTIAIIGIAIISFQQLFAYVPDLFPGSWHDPVAYVWGFFYPPASAQKLTTLGSGSGLPGAFGISIFYVIIPWIGVMMAGFGFGQLLLRNFEQVKKVTLGIGLTAIVLFIAVSTAMIYMETAENDTPFLFKLLGQRKYPPSQLFILMTLGPVIILIPWAEQIKGKFAEALKTIGRVPMFFYLLHILLIHLSAYVVNAALFGNIHQDWYETAPFVGMAEENRWGLPLLYVVWLFDVIILWFACRWYADYKKSHPENVWLKYI